MPVILASTPITLRALNRATLARQFLLERTRLSPLKALRHLVGLQAQAPDPPYLALLARLEAFKLPQLTRLLERGTVMRMASLRSTLHVIPADEALSLRGVLQPVMKRALLASRGRPLEGVDLHSIAVCAHRLLLRQPLTHADLGVALQRSWPDRNADALATAARTCCRWPICRRRVAGAAMPSLSSRCTRRAPPTTPSPSTCW